jgi:hypothetical protein
VKDAERRLQALIESRRLSASVNVAAPRGTCLGLGGRTRNTFALRVVHIAGEGALIIQTGVP